MSLVQEMPVLPVLTPDQNFSLRLETSELFDDIGQAQGIPYVVKRADGTLQGGALDQYGRTARIFTKQPEEITLLVGEGEWDILEGPEYD